MFDSDKSGFIDATEIKELIGGLGNLVSPDAIEAAIKEIDVNGDGEIDFEEFLEMMKTAAKSEM